MKRFDPELRNQLRDDLMKSVGTALQDTLPKAMNRALVETVDAQVFESIDHMLDCFFNQEDMDCWLSFTADGPEILLGMGPGDCAAAFKPELFLESHPHDLLNRAEEQEILDQITGLRNFIVVLDRAARVLEARAKVFTGRVVELQSK